MNRKLIGIIFILILYITGNISIFILSFFPAVKIGCKTWHEIYCDVDYFLDDDFLVAGSPLGGIPLLGSINDDPSLNRIYILSRNGDIKWEYTGLEFPHEVEYFSYISPDHIVILIANAVSGKIDQIYYPNKSIIWQWSPHLFDWTEYNANWDVYHDISNPNNESDYYLINDVDFINGTQFGVNYDSLLISAKNLNMIFLVNYTAEMKELDSGDKFGNASNIYWHYGMYNETDLLYKQHNPDILPNGNIVISDSENFRIIEVDYLTKQIIWELNSSFNIDLFWAKDADYIEETDTYLITDTGHNRVIEVNRTTKEILWEFKNTDLMLPYESDILPNGNILISGGGTGTLLEISRYSGEIKWKFNINSFNQSGEFHVNFFSFIVLFNSIYILAILSLLLYQSIVSLQDTFKQNDTLLIKIKILFSNMRFNLLLFGFCSILLIAVFSKPIFIEIGTMIIRMAISLTK